MIRDPGLKRVNNSTHIRRVRDTFIFAKPDQILKATSLYSDLQKVAIPRSLIAATRTLLVPHSGKLGFIFWPMPFLKLKNCGFGNYFRKTQSKLASFGIFNTFVHCFGFCCQIMSRIALFWCQILCRESRSFGATF